jgi:hypothetical protein
VAKLTAAQLLAVGQLDHNNMVDVRESTVE